MTPEPFYAIGLWYENFAQTTDEEVCELLKDWRSALKDELQRFSNKR
jgi:predicted phosphoribosyltransferase